MAEINVTIDNFDAEVIASDKPVLVDFWAPWCGPCKKLGPIVASIAEEHPELKVCKINVDDEMELSAKYQVASIPTILAFKNGELVNKTIGLSSKEELLALFN